jgi:hypothetical protein
MEQERSPKQRETEKTGPEGQEKTERETRNRAQTEKTGRRIRERE